MTVNSMRLNSEWSSRPSDQRFLSLADLQASVASRRQQSEVIDVAIDAMQIAPTEDGQALTLRDRDGKGGLLNHWSFGQLCQRSKAPAGYLRSLPATLAAIPLQWSMESHEAGSDEGNDGKLLLLGGSNVAAVTSPTYGRIWDLDVCKAVSRAIDPSVWKVPAASYSASDPKRATTLYASDRDIFIFLVSEATIEADGECLNRGFYVWNSEVGSSTFGIATFTYDRICDNRIIWGQANFSELRIRHTSGGPHRFAVQAAPQLAAYANAGTADTVATIKRAKAYEVAKDKAGVTAWLKAKGFTSAVAAKAYKAAETDPRGYNPRSVWGLVQGVTDVAHDIGHTDDRVSLESSAGRLLESLAA
jgi:hypothetical protein